jgi:hypothetical protein
MEVVDKVDLWRSVKERSKKWAQASYPKRSDWLHRIPKPSARLTPPLGHELPCTILPCSQSISMYLTTLSRSVAQSLGDITAVPMKSSVVQ